MTDILIISAVTVIALTAHIAVYRFVKFKITEGALLNTLQQQGANGPAQAMTAEQLALDTGIALKRIVSSANKSPAIRCSDNGCEYWLVENAA